MGSPAPRRVGMATPALRALLLLLVLASTTTAACPTVTRPTIFGDEALVCSGRGVCSTDGRRCECDDGAQTAAKRDRKHTNSPHHTSRSGGASERLLAVAAGWRDMWWQVEPGNIRANNGDCGGTIHAAASSAQIGRHYHLLFLTYAALFAACGWIFGPTLPCARMPVPPRLGRLSAEPWRLPVITAIAGVGTLAATVVGALFASGACDCYWLADFNKYETISALAEHAPMTVITRNQTSNPHHS